jgi:hypothetical protein
MTGPAAQGAQVRSKFVELAQLAEEEDGVQETVQGLCERDPGLVIAFFGSVPPSEEIHHSNLEMLLKNSDKTNRTRQSAVALFHEMTRIFNHVVPSTSAAAAGARAAPVPAAPAAKPKPKPKPVAPPAAAPPERRAVVPRTPDFVPKTKLEDAIWRHACTLVNGNFQLLKKFLKLAELKTDATDNVKRVLTDMCDRNEHLFTHIFGSRPPLSEGTRDFVRKELVHKRCKGDRCPRALDLFNHVVELSDRAAAGR